MIYDEDVGFICKRISERAERYANQKLKEFGLTLAQSRVLTFILMGSNTITQKDVENYLEINHSAVVGIISRLENKGLINCTSSKDDLRQKLLFPTEFGFHIYEEILESKISLNREMIKGLSEVETQQLKTLLCKIYSNLEK